MYCSSGGHFVYSCLGFPWEGGGGGVGGGEGRNSLEIFRVECAAGTLGHLVFTAGSAEFWKYFETKFEGP